MERVKELQADLSNAGKPLADQATQDADPTPGYGNRRDHNRRCFQFKCDQGIRSADEQSFPGLTLKSFSSSQLSITRWIQSGISISSS
jgi:hypothetical protein